MSNQLSNNPFASLLREAPQPQSTSFLDADNFSQNSLLERVFLMTLDAHYANKSIPVVYIGEDRDEKLLTINNIDEVYTVI
jgi:hypothetical protein